MYAEQTVNGIIRRSQTLNDVKRVLKLRKRNLPNKEWRVETGRMSRFELNQNKQVIKLLEGYIRRMNRVAHVARVWHAESMMPNSIRRTPKRKA